eukprot:11880090-Alexandrium_andersonii.AAC.1
MPLSQSGEQADLSEATRRWLAAHGLSTDRLTREEAARGRSTWLSEQAQRRSLRSAELGRLPRRHTSR